MLGPGCEGDLFPGGMFELASEVPLPTADDRPVLPAASGQAPVASPRKVSPRRDRSDDLAEGPGQPRVALAGGTTMFRGRRVSWPAPVAVDQGVSNYGQPEPVRQGSRAQGGAVTHAERLRDVIAACATAVSKGETVSREGMLPLLALVAHDIAQSTHQGCR